MIKLLTDYEWLYQYSIFCDVNDLDYEKAKTLAVEWVNHFDDIPHCQNSCHPHLNNPNGGKGDNHGTIQCRTQTSNIKQTAIA